MGRKKLTIEYVKENFEKEEYTLLDTVYVNSGTKLNYICPQGHVHSIIWENWKSGYRCPTCWLIKNAGQGNYNWKGGIKKRNVPLYDTYNSRLSYCEEIRKDPNDLNLLQVKCTKCNAWLTPSLNDVNNRLIALNNFDKGESRFYCSDECKHSCSIYGKSKYSADEKRSKTNLNFTSAEINIWSKEVLKRADYICEYCGELADQAHHIKPKKLEPFLALDPDNGIACCKECHLKYGHKDECSTGALSAIIC